MSVTEAARYRLDDLRRFASGLAGAVGVPPPLAASLATHLLWFDAVGASSHGIASLPTWLERVDRGEVNPRTEGRPRLERPGTTVFDAEGGLAPLALAKAAAIAQEKARDVGVSLTRVINLGPAGPLAPMLEAIAVQPFLAAYHGPDGRFGLAAPDASGLPALFETLLDVGMGSMPPAIREALAPWLSAFSGESGWGIVVVSVTALEGLASFLERSRISAASSWRFGPTQRQASRDEARVRGVVLEETAGLRSWATKLGIAWPLAIPNSPGG